MLDLFIQLLLALGGAALITIAVASIISQGTIKEKVKEQCSEAFKALIREKKKEAIKVGIFDSNEKELKEMEITSTQGVSDDLYVGQIIYCN